MPKLRDPVDSLRDIQRHLSVTKSRVIKLDTNRDRDWIITKIDEVALTIGTIINKLPEENKSFSSKLISTELNLIKKELEKDIPKIDYRSVVPAMCNCTDVKDAYRIARKHNMPPEEIDQIIRDAPSNTNLAKAHAALKAKQGSVAKQTKPIVVEPPADIEQEEEQNTIDSDFELDEQLRKQLGGGE